MGSIVPPDIVRQEEDAIARSDHCILAQPIGKANPWIDIGQRHILVGPGRRCGSVDALEAARHGHTVVRVDHASQGGSLRKVENQPGG